jgi:hypothetical protein
VRLAAGAPDRWQAKETLPRFPGAVIRDRPNAARRDWSQHNGHRRTVAGCVANAVLTASSSVFSAVLRPVPHLTQATEARG